MAFHNVLGLLACVAVFASGFLINGHLGFYVNASGLLIVLGGGLGATLVSYRLERLVGVMRLLRASYRAPLQTPAEMIERLVDLAVQSRLEGVLALERAEEETRVPFLRNALELLVDGYDEEEMVTLLDSEMQFFAQRREGSEQLLRTMADLFPSFGLIGSVVGLITMLARIEGSAALLQTVPIALTSTLYGVVLSNFFLLPFAAHLRERTDQELLLQKLICEGVLAIRRETRPHVIERTLRSFVRPSSRPPILLSRRLLRERLEVARPAAESS